MRRWRGTRSAAATLAALAGAAAWWPAAAWAHVKWFAPYIVGAPPAPISATLVNPSFWLGIALVLAFFTAIRLVERGRCGSVVLDGLNRLETPVRSIPVGLALALLVSVSSYWGLHLAFYGPNDHVGPATALRSTHSHNPEHPDGPTADGIIGAPPTRVRIPGS